MRTAPMPFYVALGQRIKDARLDIGYSQKDLAECIGYGRQHAPVSEIEQGCMHMPVHTMIAIADALGLSRTSLIEEVSR